MIVHAVYKIGTGKYRLGNVGAEFASRQKRSSIPRSWTRFARPESSGVGPVAAKHFEVLRKRHGRDNSNELMEEVYISLGSEYRKAGNFGKAAEVYKEGFATFPNSERLKAQIDTIGK